MRRSWSWTFFTHFVFMSRTFYVIRRIFSSSCFSHSARTARAQGYNMYFNAKINNTSIYPARRWWQQHCVSSAGFSQPDARQGCGSPLENVPRLACICYTTLAHNFSKSDITPAVCQCPAIIELSQGTEAALGFCIVRWSSLQSGICILRSDKRRIKLLPQRSWGTKNSDCSSLRI